MTKHRGRRPFLALLAVMLVFQVLWANASDDNDGDSDDTSDNDGSAPSCQFTAPDGTTFFDLSQFSSSQDLKKESGAYSYHVYPCRNAKKVCKDKDPSPVIQRTESDEECYRCGSLSSTGDGWSLIDDFTPAKGIKIKYTGGDECPGIGARTAEVHFTCDAKNTPGVIESVSEYDTCKYKIVVLTSAACPVVQGMSWGWILVILFLVAVTVYLGGGIFYMYKYKEARGVEAIPHLEFWREVPVLVKEGCEFSFFKAKQFSEWAQEEYEKRKGDGGSVLPRGISKGGSGAGYSSVR